MRSKTIILVVLFAILAIPCVHAEDAQDWYTKGQNAAIAGNYADAITYYNNALALDKNFAAAMAGKAAASNELGKYGDAVTFSEQALAIKSEDPNALNARAYALYKLGDMKNPQKPMTSFLPSRPTVWMHTATRGMPISCSTSRKQRSNPMNAVPRSIL